MRKGARYHRDDTLAAVRKQAHAQGYQDAMNKMWEIVGAIGGDVMPDIAVLDAFLEGYCAGHGATEARKWRASLDIVARGLELVRDEIDRHVPV